jgi:hypothetical protein
MEKDDIRVRNCQVCGKELNKRQEKYCSRSCYYISKLKPKVKRYCEQCGKELTKSQSENRYCSQSCMGIAKLKPREKLLCDTCGKEFETYPSNIKRGGGKYCSPECYARGRRNGETRVCNTCGKEFYISQWTIKHGWGDFCSVACRGVDRQKKVVCTCIVCGKNFPKAPSQIKEGRGKYCSKSCHNKAMTIYEIRPERATKEYQQWRKAVLERDNYTCQDPDCTDGHSLCTHHIKMWVDYPELRYDIDNGITLCLTCHYKPGRHTRQKQVA